MQASNPIVQTDCHRCGKRGPCRAAIKPPFLSNFIPFSEKHKEKKWHITHLCRVCYGRVVTLKDLK